jgi:hypothetical protein
MRICSPRISSLTAMPTARGRIPTHGRGPIRSSSPWGRSLDPALPATASARQADGRGPKPWPRCGRGAPGVTHDIHRPPIRFPPTTAALNQGIHRFRHRQLLIRGWRVALARERSQPLGAGGASHQKDAPSPVALLQAAESVQALMAQSCPTPPDRAGKLGRAARAVGFGLRSTIRVELGRFQPQ